MARTNTRRQCLKLAAALAAVPAVLGAAQGPSNGPRVAYAILMLDKPGSKAVRDAHRAAHFAYLTSFKSKLVVFKNMRRKNDYSQGAHQAGTGGTWTSARMPCTPPESR